MKPCARITHSAFIHPPPPKSPPGQTVEPVFCVWTTIKPPPSPHVHLRLTENLTVASQDSQRRQRSSEVLGNEGCWRLIDPRQRVRMSTNTHLSCLHFFTSLSEFCFCNVVISVLSGRFHPEELDSLTQSEPSQHFCFPIIAGQNFPIINHFISLYLGGKSFLEVCYESEMSYAKSKLV